MFSLLPETADRGGAVLRALTADEAVLPSRNNLGRKACQCEKCFG